ncbi:DUF1752-domain-containing protein [Coleophoma crateriformis]|uniref:DUF1752-domain-containing protein n=1 Tax=Coleophoma crateriformis TaxID=565419 RepID=A0A3D8SGT1_9HELO|nr:DUF1752-domain-containing protein [Coleophoma crateriformis]
MPSRLDAPVLSVDVGVIHKVDTRNVENLFSMWTVFSRCSGSLDEGRRLENLSWRLWTRETFCCEPNGETNATTPAVSIAKRSSEGQYSQDLPDLSASLDSIADEDVLEFDSNTSSSCTSPLEISRPKIRRQDSLNSRSRGRERHITPDDLEKMVIAIKEKKDLEPLAMSTHSYLAPIPQRTALPTPQPAPQPETITVPAIVESKTESLDSTSDQSSKSAVSDSISCNSERSTTSVVRGFSPSHVSSSYRSIPLLSAPSSIPSADIASATAVSKAAPSKKPAMFALGGSSGDDSFSEQHNSMDSIAPPPQQKKKAIFQFGGSSNEDDSSLSERKQQRSALSSSLKPQGPKKQTSFQEEVATRTIHEDQVFDDDVFETDDEDDIDESAIDDDDDSSDWEDSVEDSGKSSIDDKSFFQRVDSRPNLTSRRSLITTMLHQNDRATALMNAASRSTPALQRSRTSSPNGPSLAASPDSDDASPLMMKRNQKPNGLKPISEIPRSSAQPIIKTTTNTTPHQMALSPRTTRRNMLATELTVSLRQHLLWERQQKSQTANAVLKRRHTAHDVANLKQYPEKVHMQDSEKEPAGSWNQYFSQGLGEYHSKGW